MIATDPQAAVSHESFYTGWDDENGVTELPVRSRERPGGGTATSLAHFADQAGVLRSGDLLNASIQGFVFTEADLLQFHEPTDDLRRESAKAETIIQLLQNWLADDSEYDERVWPELKEGIEMNRLSSRSRFGA